MGLYLSCLAERTASMVMTISYTRRKVFSFGFAEPQGSKWLWIAVCDFELYIHNPNTHIFKQPVPLCEAPVHLALWKSNLRAVANVPPRLLFRQKMHIAEKNARNP